MLSMINRFFQEGKGKALKDRIDASMALKFMLAVTAVICVFMSIGTLLITVMLMRGQYRTLEAHGRDMGRFLGKVVAEPLLRLDTAALDTHVLEAIQSQDVLYAYVTNASNTVQNKASVSFNRSRDEVKDLLAREKTADVDVLVAKAKERFDPIEIQADIQLGGARIGAVKMGFSRAGIQRKAWEIVRMLVGIGVTMRP